MEHKLYLDCASTTNVHPEVLKTYTNFLASSFYNVDALYDEATKLDSMMENSRQTAAKLLNVNANEVIFTSGASEANSLAIKGFALANRNLGNHLITSMYEHASVLNAFKQLEEVFGFDVTYLKPNHDGIIDEDNLRFHLRKDTILVSIMHVNNEVGVINPVSQLAKIVKYESNACMHSDETQALGKLDIDTKNIDLLSFSAHKIEGLKGSGLLVKKQHIKLLPLINGGQQEQGLRGGTSNALVNLCFAKTLRLALENKERYHAYLEDLANYTINELGKIDGIVLNRCSCSVPNIINFSNNVLPSEVLLNALNAKNIMCSALSTCHSHSASSHVLESLGYDNKRISHSLRISFDYHHTKDDIDYFIKSLKEIFNAYA